MNRLYNTNKSFGGYFKEFELMYKYNRLKIIGQNGNMKRDEEIYNMVRGN